MHKNRSKKKFRPFFAVEMKSSQKISFLLHREFFLSFFCYLYFHQLMLFNWFWRNFSIFHFFSFSVSMLQIYLLYYVRTNSIQISIMLWYSFKFKHLHAVIFFVRLAGFANNNRTFFFFLIYLSSFFEEKVRVRVRKRKKVKGER